MMILYSITILIIWSHVDTQFQILINLGQYNYSYLIQVLKYISVLIELIINLFFDIFMMILYSITILIIYDLI